MAQYNSLNVKLSNSQLNKFKSTIKNENEVILRLSSNLIGDNETNFPHKLLLTKNTNSVFSGDNLPKVKDETYLINLDEYTDIETHWVDL